MKVDYLKDMYGRMHRGIVVHATRLTLDNVQLLDGVTAAVLAVMVPLIIADLTRGTGHFNLGQGVVGTAMGIGASLSTTLAGYLSDHFGSGTAFLGLASIATAGFAAVLALMPETRSRGG